jgi:hypothetical protein
MSPSAPGLSGSLATPGAAGVAGRAAAGVAGRAAPPGTAVTLNGKTVGGNETVEERVKRIVERAQRALPQGKKPSVSVSASETEHAD